MKSLDKKPNVLLIFSDQHNASTLGCEGHPDVMTPNLDKMASKGVRFTRAYSQNAICVPSRTSMFTGMYPRTVGCFDNADRSKVMESAVSIQRTFQKNGYRTGAFGKRHIFSAVDKGWDVRVGHSYSENPEDNYVSWIEEQGYGEIFAADWAAEFGKVPNGSKLTDNLTFKLMATATSALPEYMTMEAYTTKRSIQFIQECHDANEPFFCFASFYRPHQPYTPLKKYMDMYPHEQWGQGVNVGSSIKMPTSLRQSVDELPKQFRAQHNGENRVWRLDKAREDEQLYRNYIAAYYALVTEIDTHIGSIMAGVDAMGIEEETIIIYTSDHGDFVGGHAMVEKCAAGHNVYEETLRVPMIFRWKNHIVEAVEADRLVELIDIYPTLVDLCGMDFNKDTQDFQGKSQSATLFGREELGRDYTVSENKIQITVVTDRFKLGLWKEEGNGKDMLFDREKDPHEIENLINDRAYEEVKRQLTAYIKGWEETTPQVDMDDCSVVVSHTI